jgi:hypothetical protein
MKRKPADIKHLILEIKTAIILSNQILYAMSGKSNPVDFTESRRLVRSGK